ncbi:hypothetical protein DL98DRAFT_409677 [Cadophora sp. DSE1049]|nr:hypothetical protein DL98DRAFT_409677 [Cadophora sp. DSE1049]
MASTTLIFDPEGDLILILPCTATEVSDVRMQVSSKHLAMASPVFKAMLAHGFAEGEALRTQGKVEIPLPDDDPEAMAVLLDIIHGRSRRVPREVSVTQLALLAIVIDKYHSHEVAEVYSDIWLHHFKDEYDDFIINDESDLSMQLMWLTISWVFGNNTIFNMATANLIREDK